MTHLATVYDEATGKITATLRLALASDVALNVPPGHAALNGVIARQASQYIVDGQVAPRPALPAPVGGPAPHTVELSALPSGTVLTVANEAADKMEITDLSEALVLTDPGEYRIAAVPPFPHVGFSTTITVTEE